MFDTGKAFSGFSVDDLSAARAFYRDVLGLAVTEDDMGFLTLHLDSGATILIYGKPDHVPAGYTILNFGVPDIDSAVDELVSRGITMEVYDGMAHDEKGIMRGGGPDIAWFTDPAGNVLSVIAPGDSTG